MDRYQPEQDTCPYCGSRGNCRIHAYYRRNIGDFRDGTVAWDKVTVMRVKCHSCGHTHAILPDVIIPYLRHSLVFLLRALASHFFRHMSVEKICERYGISGKQFYKWLSIWRTHKSLWLGRLTSAETSDLVFMDSLTRQTDYSRFSSSFICKTSVSFLQSHKNPANYCQKVFDP